MLEKQVRSELETEITRQSVLLSGRVSAFRQAVLAAWSLTSRCEEVKQRQSKVSSP